MISKQNFTVIFDDQVLFWFTNARVHTQKCKWVSARSAGMYMRVNNDRLLERSFVLVVISLLQAHPLTHTQAKAFLTCLHTPHPDQRLSPALSGSEEPSAAAGSRNYSRWKKCTSRERTYTH